MHHKGQARDLPRKSEPFFLLVMNYRSPKLLRIFQVHIHQSKLVSSGKGSTSKYLITVQIHFLVFTYCLKTTQNVASEFWHFPPIFILLKLTCLVTLFDRKLQVFKNSPKWTIFGIFNLLLSTQNVNVARFARSVE